MSNVLALIPVDLTQSALGLPSRVQDTLFGKSVLAHTLARVARIKSLAKIVLIHPPGQRPLELADVASLPVPVSTFESTGLVDDMTAMRQSARMPNPAAWRGGLGSVTCYDEILRTKPMAEALEHHQGTTAVLVGPDWLLVDPTLSSQVLTLHLEHGDALQLTFCQAPPGLAGLTLSKTLLDQFAKNNASLGQVLAYNPQRPQADPIGRDVCVQIPTAVRDCPYRVIYDTPRTIAPIKQLATTWDETTFASADAVQVATTLRDMAPNGSYLPREVALELTPRRRVHGPILPQYHVNIQRPDMTLDHAKAVIEALAPDQDTFLVLGGLGDALLHPQWDQIIQMAHDAGIWGIALETDLQVDQRVLERLLELPVDVLSVRINADTAATYDKLMCAPEAPEHSRDAIVERLASDRTNSDNPPQSLRNSVAAIKASGETSGEGFGTCLKNLQWLLNTRNARWQARDQYPQAKAGLPWIVPTLVKTSDTFGDMETFYDRWMIYTGAAVIAPAQTGCGLMPAQSPVNMAPPRRKACRQLARRLTILSDGTVALCDQDWLGQASPGNVSQTPLKDLHAKLLELRHLHEEGRWDEMALCRKCNEWHRP